MSDDFATYSPDEVTVVFNGINVTGFADGTFIEVERDEDAFTHKVGSLGDVVRSRNLNKMGKATITVLAQHPVNDLLQNMFDEDEEALDGFGPFQVKDLGGAARCDASRGWIVKPPKWDRAKESTTVQWVIHLAKVRIKNAGNS